MNEGAFWEPRRAKSDLRMLVEAAGGHDGRLKSTSSKNDEWQKVLSPTSECHCVPEWQDCPRQEYKVTKHGEKVIGQQKGKRCFTRTS